MNSLMLILALCIPAADAADDKLTNSVGMELRLIPAGEYERGHNHSGQCEELVAAFPRSITPRGFAQDERPRHRVRLTKPFYLAAREVTVGQFRAFVQATGHRTTCEAAGEGIVGFVPLSPEETKRTGRHRPFERRAEFNWTRPGFEQQDSHPVVGVSWQDAQAFCRWLGENEKAHYRLPTESEWEYACRAGSDGWFSFGDKFHSEIHRHANVASLELEKRHPGIATRQWLLDVENEPGDDAIYTAPVGSYRPNRWSLYDMHGNAWEWCEDRYLDTLYRQVAAEGKTLIDPLNVKASDDHGDWRVIRGGAWCNGPILCRSATRGFFDATDAACYVGFRVAREAASRAR
jgi:formylglycine-generating enzyme required for sulfatase activity